MQVQQAQGQQQRRDQTQHDENTVFMCCNDPHEHKIAQEYVRAKYPGSKACVVSEIPVDQLYPHHTIIPIFRHRENPEGFSESVRTERHTNGTESLVNTPPATLVKEIFEAHPICVKDFLVKPSAEARKSGPFVISSTSGRVEAGPLIRALSSRLLGSVTIQQWRDDVRILKIGY